MEMSHGLHAKYSQKKMNIDIKHCLPKAQDRHHYFNSNFSEKKTYIHHPSFRFRYAAAFIILNRKP